MWGSRVLRTLFATPFDGFLIEAFWRGGNILCDGFLGIGQCGNRCLCFREETGVS